jgi:hypothetical protein
MRLKFTPFGSFLNLDAIWRIWVIFIRISLASASSHLVIWQVSAKRWRVGLPAVVQGDSLT